MKYIYEFDESAPREKLVVAYARYSSTNQNAATIDTQLRLIEAYAQNHGLHICAAYIDEACTGTNDRRHGFQKMIADAKSNAPWSKVLIYQHNRFTRNTNDAWMYTGELEDRDIDIISITQEFAPTPEGRLMTHIIHCMDQYFSENLAKVCFDGMKSVAKNGKHCGGVPPLGYDVGEDKKLHINEWEADAVRLIFDMFEMQFSYTQIADCLNEKGYHTKSGQPFNKNSFTSILKQEKYCGKYVWNRAQKKDSNGHRNTHKSKSEENQVRIDNAIPVIIEQEQFDRVQALMNSRKGGKAGINYKHRYLLSGMGVLVCSECGSKLVGKTDNRSGTRYYYCPEHKRKACSLIDIKAEPLEKLVINQLASDVYKRQDLVEIFNSINNTDEIRKLEYHLRGVRTAIRNTLKAIEKGTTPELEKKIRTLSSDRDNTEARIKDLKAQELTIGEVDRKALCKKIAVFLKEDEGLEAKQYIKTMVDAVAVSNESITVKINVA